MVSTWIYGKNIFFAGNQEIEQATQKGCAVITMRLFSRPDGIKAQAIISDPRDDLI